MLEKSWVGLGEVPELHQHLESLPRAASQPPHAMESPAAERVTVRYCTAAFMAIDSLESPFSVG